MLLEKNHKQQISAMKGKHSKLQKELEQSQRDIEALRAEIKVNIGQNRKLSAVIYFSILHVGKGQADPLQPHLLKENEGRQGLETVGSEQHDLPVQPRSLPG